MGTVAESEAAEHAQAVPEVTAQASGGIAALASQGAKEIRRRSLWITHPRLTPN